MAAPGRSGGSGLAPLAADPAQSQPPQELTAYVVFARQETTLTEVVRVVGTRQVIESSFEAAQSGVGLDQYEVRSWTGWYRHITLRMWAQEFLAILRAGAIAVEALKKAAGAPAVEPAGGLQSQTWPRLPLSVPKILRRFWRVGLAVQQTAHHILAWSPQRRMPPASAKHYHYKPRGAAIEALAA